MTINEIESILQEIFFAALEGEGINYSIRITLSDDEVIEGFKIIENDRNYILGLTQGQRKRSIPNSQYYLATIIPKRNIREIICPELQF